MKTALFLNGYSLTNEEISACEKLIKEMRAERIKQEKYKKNKEYLEEVIVAMIDSIGIDDTKRIIRDINRTLRKPGKDWNEEYVF